MERLKRIARQLMLFDPNPMGPINVQARVRGMLTWYSFGNVRHVDAAKTLAQELDDKIFHEGRVIIETREENESVIFDHAVYRDVVFNVVPLRHDND